MAARTSLAEKTVDTAASPEKRLVIIGGFATRRKTLGRIALAAAERGWIDSADQAEIFTLGQALRHRKKVVERANGARVVVHSMGHLLLEDIAKAAEADNSCKPSAVESFNRIKPTSVPKLFGGAARRYVRHTREALNGGDQAAAHWNIVTDSVVMVSTQINTLFQIRAASRYDSDTRLERLRRRSVAVRLLVGSQDEFPYRVPPADGSELAGTTVTQARCHDWLLYDTPGATGAIEGQAA